MEALQEISRLLGGRTLGIDAVKALAGKPDIASLCRLPKRLPELGSVDLSPTGFTDAGEVPLRDSAGLH